MTVPTNSETGGMARPGARLLLAAGHGALALAALLVALDAYPVYGEGASLYNWWFAPLDAVLLLAVTPLLIFETTGRGAFLAGVVLNLLQLIGLAYLVRTFGQPVWAMSAMAGLAVLRVPLSWLAVRHDRPVEGTVRGCSR